MDDKASPADKAKLCFGLNVGNPCIDDVGSPGTCTDRYAGSTAQNNQDLKGRRYCICASAAYGGSIKPTSVSSSTPAYSPSGVSISGMTLFNVNKYSVGFAGPDGNEKDLKAFLEKTVGGKFFETVGGAPAGATGATIQYSAPESPSLYSLVKLSGKTLDVQTGCPKADASCKDQDVLTQQLAAFVLDETYSLKVDENKCSLSSEPDANTACLVCGAGKVDKCPAAPGSVGPAGTGAPGGAAGPKPLKPEAKARLEQGGYVACPLEDFHVKIQPGAFSADAAKNAVALGIKLKNAPSATAGTDVQRASGGSSTPPATADAASQPSVFFTVHLIPMRDKNYGKTGVDKKSLPPNWVQSQHKSLYNGYCLNPAGFGALDSDKVAANKCYNLVGTTTEGKVIRDALVKAVGAEQPLVLNLKTDLEVDVKAFAGKPPQAPSNADVGQPAAAATCESRYCVKSGTCAVGRKTNQICPAKKECCPPAASQAPYSSADFAPQTSSDSLAFESMYYVSQGADGGLSFAPPKPAATASVKEKKAPTSASGATYNYYLFSGLNEANEKDSFYVQNGMAVKVKVYMRQWWDSKENVNPPKSPTPVKKYCSTYLDEDGNFVGEGTGYETWANTPAVPHYAVHGLVDVPKAEDKKTAVPRRASEKSVSGGTISGDEVPVVTLHQETAAVLKPMFEYLKGQGYKTYTISELEALRSQQVPKKSIAITVDDGYIEGHAEIFPLLKVNQFKATYFVISGRIGNSPQYNPKMNWDQVNEMVGSNLVSIESHTHDLHPAAADSNAWFSSNKKEAILADFRKSVATIKDKTGQTSKYFAWPVGKPTVKTSDGFGPDAVVSEAGFYAAYGYSSSATALTVQQRNNRVRAKFPANLGALKAFLKGMNLE